MGLVAQLGIVIFLILLGWLAGSAAERKHLQSIQRREREFSDMLVTDIKSFPGGVDRTKTPTLVLGAAVIATDYLKTFFARMRKIIGGQLRSYQSLLTRARREAILRMLEAAHAQGYDAVCNVRFNTSDIGGMSGARGAAMVEVHASGTAYRRPSGCRL